MTNSIPDPIQIGIDSGWHVIDAAMLNANLTLEADVVIVGTGARQRFAHPKLFAMLTRRRIGIECMDSQAACRTYNILMAEGRKAALALIIEQPADKTA